VVEAAREMEGIERKNAARNYVLSMVAQAHANVVEQLKKDEEDDDFTASMLRRVTNVFSSESPVGGEAAEAAQAAGAGEGAEEEGEEESMLSFMSRRVSTMLEPTEEEMVGGAEGSGESTVGTESAAGAESTGAQAVQEQEQEQGQGEQNGMEGHGVATAAAQGEEGEGTTQMAVVAATAEEAAAAAAAAEEEEVAADFFTLRKLSTMMGMDSPVADEASTTNGSQHPGDFDQAHGRVPRTATPDSEEDEHPPASPGVVFNLGAVKRKEEESFFSLRKLSTIIGSPMETLNGKDRTSRAGLSDREEGDDDYDDDDEEEGAEETSYEVPAADEGAPRIVQLSEEDLAAATPQSPQAN
jgi:hypothetical protein